MARLRSLGGSIALGGAMLVACSAGVGGAKNGGTGGSSGGMGVLGTPLIGMGQNLESSGRCSSPTAARAPIRRLSRIEYNNAVSALFGVTNNPADDFVPEEKTGVTIGFNTNITSEVSQLAVEQYFASAETIAAGALAGVTTVTGCGSTSDASCIHAYLTTTARRLFRGTLPAAEQTQLVADYDAAVTALGADQGFVFAVEAMLLSPRFLYTVEFGSGSEAVVPLTGSEIAGRLAASIWRSVPDASLLAKADAGALDTAAGVAAAARAMLTDPRAASMLADFSSQWLDVDQTPTLTRDTMMFPKFTTQTAADMLSETQQFFIAVANEKTGSFPELFTADYTMANANLASFYGLAAPSGSGFQKVSLPTYRRGVLTHASVITAHSHFNRPSIVLRGKMVRFELLCDPVQPPPAQVDTNLPSLGDGGTTERDVESTHASIPFCNGCHKMMDPIGFGYGYFDAVGDYNPHDGETDVSGTVNPPVLASIDDVSGPFQSVVDPTAKVDLARKIAGSQDAQQCYVIQALRYAMGRTEATGDACSAASAWNEFSKAGLSLTEVIVALTASDTFRYRTLVTPGETCQ
jgi:hypothetical protein